MPLLTRSFADKPPFRVFDVPVDAAPSVEAPPTPMASVPRGRRATDAIAS
jgi:hypothetical protein